MGGAARRWVLAGSVVAVLVALVSLAATGLGSLAGPLASPDGPVTSATAGLSAGAAGGSVDPSASASAEQPSSDRPAGSQPNILLITTDDMNASDLEWMPFTTRLLAEQGVSLDRFLSNHPLCCPARAEILTGLYGHNSGVVDNERSRFGGYQALRRPGQHIGRWLKDAGYATAFVGKYLNGWEFRKPRQRGWTVFNPIARGVYSPYDITMFRDGNERRYRGVHTSDLVGRFTIRYMERFVRQGRPFFIWASQLAPHGMFVDGEWTTPVPARRHRDAYPGAVPPSLAKPSFNEADISDKPAWVQQQPPVSVESQTQWHQQRIRSLMSVDEQVRAAVRSLRGLGVLDDTYVVFTSDNGYLMGEHRLGEKNVPYEAALRVPLLVRGGDLPAGVTRRGLYGLVDLAPTFLDMAGADGPRRVEVDGRSMLGSLRDGRPGYRSYLIQASGWKQKPGTKWWWRGVATQRFVFARYDDGFVELYDLRDDPYQLDNVAVRPEYARVVERLSQRLGELRRCSGQSCQS